MHTRFITAIRKSVTVNITTGYMNQLSTWCAAWVEMFTAFLLTFADSPPNLLSHLYFWDIYPYSEFLHFSLGQSCIIACKPCHLVFASVTFCVPVNLPNQSILQCDQSDLRKKPARCVGLCCILSIFGVPVNWDAAPHPQSQNHSKAHPTDMHSPVHPPTCGRNIFPAPKRSPTTFMPSISGPSITWIGFT